ncbi:MAG: reverse transcriptase family protein, partial [Leadbetterella sp.]
MIKEPKTALLKVRPKPNTSLRVKTNKLIKMKGDTKTTKIFFEGKQMVSNFNAQGHTNEKGIYSVYEPEDVENVFNQNCQIGNRQTKCLIDTGADISLIHISKLPKGEPIHKVGSERRIKSATGNYIKIIGCVKKLIIKINNVNYYLDAYVTNDKPVYTILGVKFILQNPKVLTNILQHYNSAKFIKQSKSIKVNSITEEDNILTKYHFLFKDEISDYSLCTTATHRIETGIAPPFKHLNQRIPVHWETQIKEEIDKNLKLGIIRESNSPWSSRLVPISKPDGSLRLCIDYRTLNNLTTKDNCPLPRIDEITDSLAKASIYSTLDATSGFYQIAIEEADIPKTAFTYKNGLYEFVRMPFGLCNAPGTFQRAMDTIFRKDLHKYVIPYLDDIIIFSNSIEEHKIHLDSVLKGIQAAGLILNKKKCKFFKEEVKILGSIVSKGKVKPDPNKISAIRGYTRPSNIKELRSFLGLCNYSRQFVRNYASIALPLFQILKNETKRSIKQILWNEERDHAFQKLKSSICDITYRAQPNFN